jgi:uncharacterized membrane protein
MYNYSQLLACASLEQEKINMDVLVQLPEELKALIGIIVTLLVTEVLKFVAARLNIDLSGYAAQVTAALVGAVVVFINAALSNVPAEFAPIANSLLGLVVVVLGSFGAYKVLLSKKPKG